jgi:hypothetical protein
MFKVDWEKRAEKYLNETEKSSRETPEKHDTAPNQNDVSAGEAE